MDRTLLLGAGMALLVTLSGCSALLGEDLTFAASKATIDDDALSEAGYETVSVESRSLNRTVSVAGQERTVRLTNWVATYDRDFGGDAGTPGTVVVLATPEVSIAGQSLNPVGQLSSTDLVDTLLEQYGPIGETTPAGTESMTVLGTETTVSSYRTTIDVEQRETPVLVHVTTVQDEGDYVVLLSVHPATVSADRAGVRTMFEGVTHDGK
ncbi:MAG: DUF6517 family protein [Halanaeroarchaeum sp.]